MKKILPLILISGAILFSSCTINKPAEPDKFITVSGSGSVLVKPDLVSINFGVKTMDRGVTLTAERNAAITEKVINALVEAGIAASDISTYDYRVVQENQQQLPGRYTVSNTINVLVRNPESTGAVIDTAIANGANTLNNFEYLISDKTTALRQARTLAVQDAQDAATLLAGASGSKVGIVLEINENYTSTSSGVSNLKMMAFDGSTTTPISSGTIAVQSNVSVKYSLE